MIATNELIFGTHVHVAIEGADKAIYVADGIRRYLPLFLALSANSPFWVGNRTGLMSSRVPVFRAFPREEMPPHYGTWEIFSHRIELMMRAGAIEDYTFLWWDVRPHPKLGTVETRIFDQQTHVEHTVALAALNLCLAHRMSTAYDDEEPLVEYPSELIDDNKIRAARWGTDGRLIDFRAGEQVPAKEMARDLLSRLAPNAEELGCAASPRHPPARSRHRSPPPTGAGGRLRGPPGPRGQDRGRDPPLTAPLLNPAEREVVRSYNAQAPSRAGERLRQ